MCAALGALATPWHSPCSPVGHMRHAGRGVAIAVALAGLLAAPAGAQESVKARTASATTASASGAAAGSTGARFCAAADLVGEWSMLRMIPWRAKVDRRDASFADHQRFV